MKYIFLLLLSVVVCGASQEPETTVDLKILVTNINTQKGSIHIGVFNNPKTFLRKGKEYKTFSKKVTNDTVIFILNGLTKADYAISIYHDINSDNECNLNFIGIPLEPYGFSKNYKPKFSKPSFENCKVNVQKNMSTTIELID